MNYAYSGATVAADFVRFLLQLDEFSSISDTVQAALLSAEKNRVAVEDVNAVLNHLAQAVNNPALGFTLGRQIPPAAFSTLGHLVMVSNTVEEAMVQVEQFQNLITDAFLFSHHYFNESLCYSWQLAPASSRIEDYRILIDLIMSATRQFGLWITDIDEPFLQLHFQYACGSGREQAESLFGCKPIYNSRFSGFIVPRHWAERSIRSAAPALQRAVYQQADQELSLISDQGQGVAIIEKTIASLLPEGRASLEEVAAVLGISCRSLQRRLRRESLRFSEVLQTVRLRKAEQLLSASELSLADIAAQLGYQEQSSFSNAYRQWTGCSPRYRRRKALVEDED